MEANTWAYLGMPTDPNHVLSNSLLVAIGRVTTASATLENALRHAVMELAGNHDRGWIIFEGQSLDWLILNGNAVLGEYEYGGGLAGRVRKNLQDLFRRAERLRNDRNIVIHGEWSGACFFPETCKSHSPVSKSSENIFHVLRSRYRKGYVEEAWSLSEIESLASELNATAREFDSAIAIAWK
jgi:hypothetical protein